MNNEKKHENFVLAAVGTLWYYDKETSKDIFAATGGPISIGDRHAVHGFILFGLVDPRGHKTLYSMIPHGNVIVKLENGKPRRRVISTIDKKWVPRYFKVMATDETGEVKIGWMKEKVVECLVPYKEIGYYD